MIIALKQFAVRRWSFCNVGIVFINKLQYVLINAYCFVCVDIIPVEPEIQSSSVITRAYILNSRFKLNLIFKRTRTFCLKVRTLKAQLYSRCGEGCESKCTKLTLDVPKCCTFDTLNRVIITMYEQPKIPYI